MTLPCQWELRDPLSGLDAQYGHYCRVKLRGDTPRTIHFLFPIPNSQFPISYSLFPLFNFLAFYSVVPVLEHDFLAVGAYGGIDFIWRSAVGKRELRDIVFATSVQHGIAAGRDA